jgi:formate dehydrogenase subunit beta
MNTIETGLRTVARQLLEESKVNIVIGYGRGSVPYRTRPVFVKRPEDVGQLVWNPFCSYNLVRFLTRPEMAEYGKIGVVVKSCDAKAAACLIQEEQIDTDRVVLIGVPCDGVVEPGKAGQSRDGFLDGFRPAKCDLCNREIPAYVEIRIGQPQVRPVMGEAEIDRKINELEQLDPAERWAYWQAQFEKCIRCYACRQQCPLCYCSTCVADKTRPDWVESSSHARGNLNWHIIRALHLAGRCILCGQCEAACPVGIPLLLLNRKMALTIKSNYGYEPGVEVTGKPPIAEYKQEDQEDFIR